MKIKSLEAIGFKSFVDRLHLNFPGGITSIVGPNGCGKSNVVDAILWAIGERSAKHLRGKLMEDVIFNGADGRKPLGMAEVSLTFSNEDGMVPPEYQPYSEITVTRRLYRSGESEYLINKTPCRLRDITDLFLDTGIGINGYSIVEQGRVEYLINSNPQDRRLLIEEAAGIAKYKERKRLALMKMEATQQNLLRIQDIIAEVKRQIVTLERQVKRAEEFKSIRKEVKEIEIRFALQEYNELSVKGETARGYLKALREQEERGSAQVAEKEALIESKRLSRMTEEERLQNLQQEVFELGRNIQKLENELEFFRKEIGSFQRQEQQSIGEVRETFQAWRGTRREQRKAEQSMKDLYQLRREREDVLKEWENLFREFKSTNQELSEELETEKENLVETITRITSLKNRQIHLEERREDLQKRIRSNGEENDVVIRQLHQSEETVSQKRQEKEQNLSIQKTYQDEKARWEGELEQKKSLHRRKQTERSDIEETLRQNRSRYLSLKELQENFEGFEKGVKSLLLRKKEHAEEWERILGVVADILEPEPSYDIPLEAVLGQRLQYLIVEGEKEGMEVLSYLKRESLGRGNFIPKGTRGTGKETSVSHSGDQPVSLLDFVRVKEGYRPLAEFLIGETGVVGDLEKGLNWFKQEARFSTLVTFEGDVVERSGVLSGGSRDQGLGILERRREIKDLEKKIEVGEERCREATIEEGELQKDILTREGKLENRKKEIQEKEIELLHQERDQEGLEKEIAQLKQNIEVLQAEKTQLEAEKQEIEKESEITLIQMEKEEAMKQEKEEELQSWKKKVEEVREGTEELGGKLTELKVYLASLEEKQKGLEVQIQNLSDNQRTSKEQILKRINEIRGYRHETAALHEKIRQGEQDLEENLKTYRVKEGLLAVEREKVETLSNEWKEIEASSRYLHRELEEVRQKVHEQEMIASEIQLKVSHLQESIRERYGTTLSSSIANGPSELPNEAMAKRLAELKGALEGFGEVNLMAIEEYQELKQRHDFLSEQQGDLQQALDALKKAISRINRTTTKRFLETYHQVNERFKEMFARLFKGGQARLILLDEQDPATTGIDIMAQPPGKKLQNIDLLSGGEKALVATALLFGIFMIKPTPFCLLDEMDAPMDDANINRFIDLVKEFSKSSQFILITHNKSTMEAAQTLYGITMETPGVSKVVSVRLN